jgi:hypothetical protein
MVVEGKTLPLPGSELQPPNTETVTSVSESFQQWLCSYSLHYKYLIFELRSIFSVYMFGIHNDLLSTVKLKVSQ